MPRSHPRLDWKVDPARAVLLIHDMQNYFVDVYEAGTEPLATVVPTIVGLRDACDAADVPVVLTAQPPNQHPSRRGLLTDRWGPGIATEEQAQVIEPLAARPGDITVVKWRYSAFARTDLRSLMAHTGRDQLIITGIYAHIGCLLTAADAFMQDIQVFFVSDGVADFSAPFHAGAVDYVNNTCGIVLSADEVTRGLKADG
ncbi:isochorismatase family protein [Gordonia crocea]|uniref:isochorismatase family protein n=1 Tax=Gordonia crocea TaxID=589162 RepID=UPI001E5A02C7|nr:isochorismatase family protein [Gordonia crocea]